jgi:hypothetical protein
VDFGLRKNLACLNKDTRIDPEDGTADGPAGPGREPDPRPGPESAVQPDGEGVAE